MNLKKNIKENFDLNSVDQVYFWKSEWEKFDPGDKLCNVSVVYLIYRCLFMSYFVGSTIYNMTCSDMNLYFIFLTNWTFTLQLVYSIIYFVRLVWVRIDRREVETRLFSSNNITSVTSTTNASGSGGFCHQSKLPWPEKIIWIFVNIVSVIPYGVTLGYWAFLFDPDKMSESSTCDNVSNFLVHAINSPMALLDSIVMAIPIRITHMIFPIIVAFIYAFFSGIYEVSGGTYSDGREYIYPILDWKNSPGWAAGTSIAGLIFSGIAHAGCCWGIYRLRVIIVNKYFSKRRSSKNSNELSNTKSFHDGSHHQNKFAYSNPIPVDDKVDGERATSDNLNYQI